VSYDVHIYAFESSVLPLEILAERAAHDGWRLDADRASLENGFPSLIRVAGNPKALFRGTTEDARFEFVASFSSQLDDIDRENLATMADELSEGRRRHLKKCVAHYELSTATVPDADALPFMQRLAFHIACSVGGVYEDPQEGDVKVLRKDAPLPKWRRKKTVEEIIGPLGVLVRDWATQHGYTIPEKFFEDHCERYVFLITSFDPPKLRARTYWFETEILPHLAKPMLGYAQRVFDFKDRVELARDGDWYKVVGPIPGLPERRSKRRRSRG
jgi:hypothetical protein